VTDILATGRLVNTLFEDTRMADPGNVWWQQREAFMWAVIAGMAV